MLFSVADLSLDAQFKNRTWVMLLVLPSYRIHSIFVYARRPRVNRTYL
jgi:hypothetical protein